MACGCSGGSKPQSVYVVTLSGGKQVEVTSEQAARVEISRAGGGSYRIKK